MKNEILSVGSSVIDLQIKALRKLKSSINEEFFKAVNKIYKCKSKVIICGVGKSGIIASKISATLSSVGTPSFTVSANDCSHGDLGRITNKDILILISNSGNTNELKNIIKYAKSYNIFLIGIMSNKNSILDLFVIYNDMARDNRQLKPKIKSEKFVNDYIKKVVSLIDKETFTLNPYQKKAKEKKTFYKMLGGRQHYNNQYRRDLIRKKLNLDKYFVQLDNTRVVSNKTKLVVAVKHQKGKTFEGKDIDLSKLQSGKYHKGHKEPHRIGGKATKENTVIQENMDNWKLGSKTIN